VVGARLERRYQSLVLGPVPQWKPDLNKVVASHFWEDTPDRLRTYLDPATVELTK